MLLSISSLVLLLFNYLWFVQAPQNLKSNYLKRKQRENKNSLRSEELLLFTTEEISEGTIWHDFKTLFKTKGYVGLTVLFILTFGSFVILWRLLATTLAEFEFSDATANGIFMIGVLIGILGSGAYFQFSGFLKSRRMDISILIMGASLFLSLTFMCLSFEQVQPFIVMYCIFCFFWYPLIPIILEISAKAKFKASHVSVNAFMNVLALLFTLLVKALTNFLIESRDSMFIIMLIVFAFSALAFLILNIFLKEI